MAPAFFVMLAQAQDGTTANPENLQTHYGNLVFMGVFFVVVIAGIVWWVWRNN